MTISSIYNGHEYRRVNMSSAAILDIQCVLNSDNKYMIKELSIVDVDTWASQHYIFKLCNVITQNLKSRNVNKWLENNYHGLSLNYGDIEYKELDRILNSFKFELIYVKGLQKQAIIKEIIPQIDVINLEDLGCPRLDQLCIEDGLPCCVFHKYSNTKQCSFHKVFALKKWFINNS